MNTNETQEMTALTQEEARRIDGGVTEGGCIDPVLQKIIDALGGHVPASLGF